MNEGWWLEGREWTKTGNGIWMCSRPGGCELIKDYEGECQAADCDGTQADVLYRHTDDPDYRCEHGYRLCADCPPEIVAFACHTCGLVQDPEPELGQGALF